MAIRFLLQHHLNHLNDMVSVNAVILSICQIPISLLESLFAQWCWFSSRILKSHMGADDECVYHYRKITLKRTCLGIFQIGAASIIFYYVISNTFWFFKPHFFTSAPLENKPTTIDPVIVTIATNGHSARDLVRRLRYKGEYYGDIYVIGDGCAGLEPDSEKHVMFVHVENLGDGQYKEAANKGSKQLKEKLFSLIDEFQQNEKNEHPEKSYQPVQRILYLDSDVDVNAPIAPFFATIGPKWDSSCNAYMFRERRYTRTAFSTVILLLDRKKSENLLKGWGEVIVKHPEFPRDHLALSLFLARDGQEVERTEHSPKFVINKICELPFEGGMSYGSDFVTKLRGTHATTFTHSSGHETVPSTAAC